MSELSNLIDRLKRGIVKRASYISTIRHPELLVIALQELNDMIGLDKVKDSVATQVSHLIMIKRRASETSEVREDEVMLNTILYGPPGTGKTECSTKLAKIWYALGYLNGTKNPKAKKSEIGSMIRDLFESNGGDSSTDNNTLALYIILIFVILLITFISIAWSVYEKFGGPWTIALVILVISLVIVFGIFISMNLNNSNSSSSSSAN